MFHTLTLGHLDAEAAHRGQVVVIRTLDVDVGVRLVNEFGKVDDQGNAWVGSLPVRFREGFITCPWPGTRHALVEDFARRLQAETGCLVADVQHRQTVDLDRIISCRLTSGDQPERPPKQHVG